MRQLIGYVAFAYASDLKNLLPPAGNVAVYFSRFGLLHNVPLPAPPAQIYRDAALQMATIWKDLPRTLRKCARANKLTRSCLARGVGLTVESLPRVGTARILSPAPENRRSGARSQKYKRTVACCNQIAWARST